jgi:hypothetical protein
MSSPTKYCRDCGLLAPLPVMFGAVLPACSICGCKKYVEEADLPWELRVDNEHDRLFLKINRISTK